LIYIRCIDSIVIGRIQWSWLTKNDKLWDWRKNGMRYLYKRRI